MYTCTYIYTYMYIRIHIHIHIYIYIFKRTIMFFFFYKEKEKRRSQYFSKTCVIMAKAMLTSLFSSSCDLTKEWFKDHIVQAW